jgi:hypothetical protein
MIVTGRRRIVNSDLLKEIARRAKVHSQFRSTTILPKRQA